MTVEQARVGSTRPLLSGRDALFCSSAILFLAVDLQGVLSVGATSGVEVTLMVVSTVFLAMVARWSRSAGLAVIACFVLVGALPRDVAVTTVVSLGIYLVVADWASDGRWSLVALWFAIVGVSSVLGPSDAYLNLLLEWPLGILVTGVGVVIRHHRGRVVTLEEDLDEFRRTAAAAEERVREDLTSVLHDGIAADLTLALLRTRALAQQIRAAGGDPSAVEEVEGLVGGALADTRGLLAAARRERSYHRPAGTLGATVEQCRQMLAGRRMSLETSILPDVQGTDWLPTEVVEFLLLLVRECSLNAVKYAAPGSAAVMSLDLNDVGVDFAYSSVMDAADASLAENDGASGGGMGLVLLASRAEALGGVLMAAPVGGNWVVTGSIAVPESRRSDGAERILGGRETATAI